MLRPDTYRRRALSMEPGAPRPPPSMYQAPSVAGFGAVDEFDDGGSVAGSALTFMDGSIGGRVSQYGLPKYETVAKPDPRR